MALVSFRMLRTQENHMLEGPRVAAKSGTAKSLVILLHGYGADGNDLIGLAGPMGGALADTEFVSPNAPEPCAAAPMGRQWFPISYIDGSTEEAMREGMARAVVALDEFIDAEIERSGLPASKVALMGFSQGTMMSLHVAPRRAGQLACVVGFSGRLLEPERLAGEIVTRPPVLLIHGDADPVVPFESMQAAGEGLAAAGVEVSGFPRPGLGHGIDEQGMAAAAQFLMQHLSDQPA